MIMKWIKQTFAQRYNRLTGRIGHVWGDRYWSEVLEGESWPLSRSIRKPEGESVGGAAERGAESGVRPHPGKQRHGARFSPKSPPPAVISPG